MYGFQPKHARGKPAQALADGGLVHSIKGMLGLRPKTREELLAADAKAQARNQDAAGRVAERSAQQPAPATPAPPAAISDYSGMNAMQRREKEQGLKNGGMVKPHGFKAGGLIRGPGTGTSDSIETEKRPGTFIMPADSTQAIGPEALEELGEAEEMEPSEGMGRKDATVPVRLSNGEFELPPEQVQALGEAVLTVLRNATHKPAGEQGEAPTGKGFTPHQFFSGGGTVKGRTNKFDVEDWANQQEQERSARTQATLAQAQAQSDQNDAEAVARQGAKSPVGMTPGEAHRAGLITSATPVGYNPAYDQRVNGAQGAAESRVAQIPVGSNVPVPAPIGTQPGRTPEPAAQPAAPVPTAASTQSAGQPLDAQAASDRAKLGAAWDTVKDVNDSAGRAIADVAMLAPRAVAGAYDSAVVRPMRAAGFNAGYLSPILVPNGVDPSSMTPYTDQKRMQEQAGAVAPSAPAATSSVAATASTAGAGRGSVNPPLANPSAPAPSTQPEAKTGSEIMPGVFKHGRGQYSDQSTGMAMPAGFTGQPSAQNMAAADALAARQTPAGFQPAGSQPAGVQAPVVRNSTNDWAARNALRNAEVSASSITNRPEWQSGSTTQAWSTRSNGVADPQGKVAAYRAAVASDQALQQAQPGMDKAAMDANAALQREGTQQAGANQRTAMQEQGATARDAGRTALAGEELSLKRTAAGFQTRAAKRSESAYDNYSKAKTDEDRQAIAKQFPDLFGQAKDAAHRMEVVRGKTDPMTGQSSGDYVVVQDPKTGDVRQIQMGAASAPQAMPKPASKAEFDALPKGTRFTDPNGQVRIK